MLTKLYVKTTMALENFKKDERGVTAIEYALIGVAMAAIITSVFATSGDSTLGAALQTAMSTIAGDLD